MAVQLFQVNAFTRKPFGGNPAAVCLWQIPLREELMQAIATEMNLSETAFVYALPNGKYRLRWFTPTTEVELCGHATLAAAHVLIQELGWAREEISFETQSGLIFVKKQNDIYHMQFPLLPIEPMEVPEGLVAALGQIEVVACYQSTFDLVVELTDAAAVRQCQPDINALARFPYRGIIITASGQSPYDFVSRFFGPNCGVPEDPVTGSAHCALAPLWAKRLNKQELIAWQASRRGGEVHIQLEADSNQLWLKGSAITIWKGELCINPSSY